MDDDGDDQRALDDAEREELEADARERARAWAARRHPGRLDTQALLPLPGL